MSSPTGPTIRPAGRDALPAAFFPAWYRVERHHFSCYCAQRAILSSLQCNIGDRVNFPDHWHVVVQAGGPGTSTVRMTHVEEQRALDLDGYRRIVEIIGGTRKVFTKERRERVSHAFQANEAGIVR